MMGILSKTGRIFYGSAIAATGIQQIFFREIFQILFPPMPFRIPGIIYFTYMLALFLVGSGMAIGLNIKTRLFGYILGSLFCVLFIFCYAPYELFISPYSSWHLGLWTNALKGFAFAGGAFVIASEMPSHSNSITAIFNVAVLPKKIATLGSIMFSTTMICFGIDHFYYTATVEKMVPGWIPNHLFWTYFAGVALIGSGISIILRTRIRLFGNLLGLMIFLWFVFLHIPDAIANPISNNGNEVTSAFSALAFSGIAFIIANSRRSNRSTAVKN